MTIVGGQPKTLIVASIVYGFYRLTVTGADSNAFFVLVNPSIHSNNCPFPTLTYFATHLHLLSVIKSIFIYTCSEKGENMKDIPSNSMDAAVTTMTLCHADDELKFASEIRRVLAPGAKYYFWEHIHPFHDGSCGHGHGHAGHSHGHRHGKDHGAHRSLNRNLKFIFKLLFGDLRGGQAGHHAGSHEREVRGLEIQFYSFRFCSQAPCYGACIRVFSVYLSWDMEKKSSE